VLGIGIVALASAETIAPGTEEAILSAAMIAGARSARGYVEHLAARSTLDCRIGYSRPMHPLPLNQRLDRIGQHIVRARLFLDLWFYFEERDSRRQIIETMREYNEFFRFTPHAYLVA
jgi:hypothetical protein